LCDDRFGDIFPKEDDVGFEDALAARTGWDLESLGGVWSELCVTVWSIFRSMGVPLGVGEL
tara:strand:- start:11199 stop:11381 length:183 start_codon:yes stop_codon:yes gene_type:complete